MSKIQYTQNINKNYLYETAEMHILLEEMFQNKVQSRYQGPYIAYTSHETGSNDVLSETVSDLSEVIKNIKPGENILVAYNNRSHWNGIDIHKNADKEIEINWIDSANNYYLNKRQSDFLTPLRAPEYKIIKLENIESCQQGSEVSCGPRTLDNFRKILTEGKPDLLKQDTNEILRKTDIGILRRIQNNLAEYFTSYQKSGGQNERSQWVKEANEFSFADPLLKNLKFIYANKKLDDESKITKVIELANNAKDANEFEDIYNFAFKKDPTLGKRVLLEYQLEKPNVKTNRKQEILEKSIDLAKKLEDQDLINELRSRAPTTVPSKNEATLESSNRTNSKKTEKFNKNPIRNSFKPSGATLTLLSLTGKSGSRGRGRTQC